MGFDHRFLGNIYLRCLLKNKSRFCNFIVSNGNAMSTREEFFHKLSAHQKIDSVGRFFE